MSQSTAIFASVSITVDSVAKQFNAVSALNYNFFTGMVNIVDETGSFYFSIKAITTLTHVIAGTTTTVVMT